MYIDWDVIKFLVAVVLVVVLFFGGIFAVDRWSCAAKTSGMGFAHSYSILGGCKIEVQAGKWIPLESYYFKQQ